MCAQANFERLVETIIANIPNIDTGKGFENYVFELTTTAVHKARLPFKVQRSFKANGSDSVRRQII